MARKKTAKKKAKTRRTAKANAAPAPVTDAVEVRRENGKVWSHVRQMWLVETPEERVRQEYLCVLVNEYGFQVSQIAEEESVTGRGSAQARADFLIWRSAQDRADDRPALIVVECKSDNVTISAADYSQGDNYARREGAKFFVTHNNRETRFWRVRTDRRPGYLEEIENIPHADASDRDIEELIAKLKTFKEDEFADLLHNCHNVIRNREHLDPAAAFDEIAKVLFVKTWVEREMKRKRQRQNLFTADWLDTQLGDSPLGDLFQKTKDAYSADRIFGDRERLNLKPATGREIVRLLERYNLSHTVLALGNAVWLSSRRARPQSDFSKLSQILSDNESENLVGLPTRRRCFVFMKFNLDIPRIVTSPQPSFRRQHRNRFETLLNGPPVARTRIWRVPTS